MSYVDYPYENQLLCEENKQLRAEINEQARLLGISAEKELALRAENERLKTELAAALAACEKMGDFLQFAWRDVPMSEYAFDRLESVLAIQPDASALKAHDEALIERVIDHLCKNGFGFQGVLDAIRELKSEN